MFKLGKILSLHYKTNHVSSVQKRQIQVSVVGANNPVGSNVALFLMQNPKITRLHLYDDDEKIKGIARELACITRGSSIHAFTGEHLLPAAIRNSSLILMVYNALRSPTTDYKQMLAANAPAVQRLCKAIADQNKDAFLAISTNPINSIVPFVGSLMQSYGSFNPFKMCGITNIDSARARKFAASVLKASPHYFQVPVIGGHSDQTIVPLFSNLTPCSFSLDSYRSQTLTKLLRKADLEVIRYKQGEDSAVLCTAWSITEFTDSILSALYGYESNVHCFSMNPYYGTRYFGGPAMVGPQGIIRVCSNMPMSEAETSTLNYSIPILNKDVCLGENYVNVISTAKG